MPWDAVKTLDRVGSQDDASAANVVPCILRAMGTRKSHKKQHYVPASYLKAWVDPDCPEAHEPYVWVFPKEGGQSRRRAPRNLFTETDFYTITDADGGRDLTLEHGLAGLENDFAQVANRLARDPHAELDDGTRRVVDMMVASLHARTLSQAEHWRSEWGRVDDMTTKMQEAVERMSPGELQRVARQGEMSGGVENGMSQDDVRQILQTPQQVLLQPQIAAMLPALRSMNMVLLQTDDALGFITSDAPVVIGDPNAAPGGIFGVSLMSESVEVYLPLSPSHCVLLHRGRSSGPAPATRSLVDEVNRRVRFSCHESFVARRDETDPYWFAEIPRG